MNKGKEKREQNTKSVSNNPNHMENLKPFSKDNQPTPEQKKQGWSNKKAMQDLAECVLDKDSDTVNSLKKLATKFGLTIEKYTLSIALTLKQIEKAYNDSDTQAFNAAMDRMVGKAQAHINHTNDGEKFDSSMKVSMANVWDAKMAKERQKSEQKQE